MALFNIQHALDLLDSDQAAEAVPILAEWSDRMPAYATPYVLLARAYEALGQWDEARQAWQHAHFLLPNSPVVQEGLRRVQAAMAPPEPEVLSTDLDIAGTLDLDEPFDPEKAVDADLAALDLGSDDLHVDLEAVDAHLEPISTHLEPLDAHLENLDVGPLFDDLDLEAPPAEPEEKAAPGLEPTPDEAGAPDRADATTEEADADETEDATEEADAELDTESDEDVTAGAADAGEIEVEKAEEVYQPAPAEDETAPDSLNEPEDVETEEAVEATTPPEPSEPAAPDAADEEPPEQPPDVPGDEEEAAPPDAIDEAPSSKTRDDTPAPEPLEEATDEPSSLDPADEIFPLELDEPTDDTALAADEPETTAPADPGYLPAVRAALAAAEANDEDEADDEAASQTDAPAPKAQDTRSIYEEIDELIDTHGDEPSPDDRPDDTPDLDIAAFEATEDEIDLEAWDDFDPVPEADSHPPLATPVDDLDRLIEELESARIVPNPDLDDVPEIELDDEIDDMVSETLARIYASQKQYHEAARIYEQLARQQPDQAEHFQQQAAEMRALAKN